MRTFILSIVSVIVITLASFNNDTVCPTPATISVESDWTIGSIYDIQFVDNCPMINDEEVLLSVQLFDAITTILMDDNTAYGDYAIEFKYIEDKGIYIANLIDEFIEL